MRIAGSGGDLRNELQRTSGPASFFYVLATAFQHNLSFIRNLLHFKYCGNAPDATCIVNLGDASASVSLKESELKLSAPVKSLRDLWAHQPVSFTNGTYTATIPSHGTLLLRASVK